MKFYREILDNLIERKPFKFSRWGDGEWLCMMGEEGENRDGNRYLPELGDALYKILLSRPEYYMGLQYGVMYNEQLREFVFTSLLEYRDIDWVYGDILHVASEFGYLKEFTDILKERNTWIIGAKYFGAIPWAEHIEIPPADSFKYNDKLFGMSFCDPDAVYLVAAAMNSNVIIDALPDSVTAIDIGSVLDPYLGRPRASYQYNIKFPKLW